MLINKDSKIHLIKTPADMRIGARRLASIAAESQDLEPMSGTLFLFFNRQYRILKILLWDGRSFVLISKHFQRSMRKIVEEHAGNISPQEVNDLLNETSPKIFFEHKNP